MMIKMKNVIKYTKACTLLLLLTMTVSCSDFLEENPEHTVSQSNYYTTAQDARAAVNAIYAYLAAYNLDGGGPFPGNTAGVYHSTFWVTIGLASDNMENNQLGAIQNDQLSTFSYNPENSNLSEIWRIHYKVIFLANIAIERIPEIAMNADERAQLVNEAKFLRGLMYFNLVRMFGKVPLVTSEEAPLTPEAAEVDEIYTQIITDFTDAEALPADGAIQEGRATRGAAKAMLSKVYLTLKDFENASKKAFEVIDGENYALWENFEDVFKLSSRGGKEAIFSVGFGDAGGGISFWEVGQFNVRLLPVELANEREAVTNAQGWQVAAEDLYNSYSNDDARKAATFMTSFLNDAGETVTLDKVYIQKYWDEEANPGANASFNDFPVIRYAEVLLIYAEAQAELNNFPVANEYLNMVRERADLDPVSINDIEAFREAVLLERRKEFVAEGKRWFDLVRTGKLQEKVQEAKGITVAPAYKLFPIPQAERNVNPALPQNDGY